MNVLLVGSEKEPLLHHLPPKFLMIDDGALIDQLDLPKRQSVTVFDADHHSFNPLKDMSYLRARDFVDVLNAAFPEGENTLTKRYASFILLQKLLAKPRLLDKLVPPSKDPYQTDAYQKVQTILMSPVLERVLNRPTNFSFKGTIIARLDRAVLGDFDAFVLANLLISLYPGPVVIPDFGFYACTFHSKLIRQERLIAGISSFSEVPKLRSQLTQIETKIGSRCIPEDAKLLALYEGLLPDTVEYSTFIQQQISP